MFEAWQQQQRDIKNAERRKQKESAEALQRYRGNVTDEDRKLAKLREEERKRQQESAEYLRSYKGTAAEDEARALAASKERRPSQKQHAAPLVTKQEEDISAVIAAGTVSTMAAGLITEPHAEYEPTQSSLEPHSSSEHTADPVEIVPTDEQTYPPVAVNPFDGLEAIAPGTVPNLATEYAAESAKEYMPSSSLNPNGTSSVPDIGESEPAPTESLEETAHGHRPEEEPLHDHPTVVRLDVHFSFGLVTLTSDPVLNGYLLAVEEIVRAKLAETADLAEHVLYDAHYTPFVVESHVDDNFKDKSGRGNVLRIMVTAAVPVFLSNGISISHVREGVISALQSAVSSGEFLRIAQTINE